MNNVGPSFSRAPGESCTERLLWKLRAMLSSAADPGSHQVDLDREKIMRLLGPLKKSDS